ncbi:hypothetical protein FC677_29570 [Bacillus cereus]|uniref:hypothetical protein n=1 Tax=Bacillus cereus TaxID=1396 RepID=UPI0010BDC5CC|nr:hypothetical protein [Bacillus cereus]TKH48105.1 hypothetical protein FC677_29570 [Bacillus cereus]
MPKSLQIDIPTKQREAHKVHLKGSFDANWGIQVTTHNPYGAPIDRVRNLTITDNEFIFESLYLNETGYTFLIQLLDEEYTVLEATDITLFRVIP